MGQRNLVNIQGSPLPSSGMMLHNKDKSEKCQKACVDEQRTCWQTQTKEGCLQRVETRTGSLGIIQRMSDEPGIMLGKLKPDRIKSGQGHNGQQEELL